MYDGDGGDSSNRTSVYLILQSWENNPQPDWAENVFSILSHPWFPGIHRRHPDETKWYGDWKRMSRDQTIPMLIAFDEYHSYSYSIKYILGHILRLGLVTTNILPNWADSYISNIKFPDLTGPDFWALEIRSLPFMLGVVLYPILMILDLYNMGSAIFLRFNKSQNDVINHVIYFIHAQRKLPTPFIWFSNKFINNVNDLQYRLDHFFGEDLNQPKFNELLKPWLIKYFQT